MTDTGPDDEIEALIEAYSAGFDDYDGEAISACFAYPAVVWQFGKGHVFADFEEMIENINAILKVYEEAGITVSSFEINDLSIQGDTALATVEWSHENDDGEVLFDFACHYHLAFDGDTWRIAMVVNIDEDDEADVEAEDEASDAEDDA